jgi:hypothetical protein
MVDLGLYNFIKNGLAHGKTKADLTQSLLQSKINQESIDAAFDAVAKGKVPAVQKPPLDSLAENEYKATHQVDEHARPAIITALCGYYFVTWILAIVNAGMVVLLFWLNTKGSVISLLPNIKTFNLQIVVSIVIAVCFFFGVVGYWNMKRWGVVLYTLTVVGSVIYTFGKAGSLSQISQTFTLPIFLSLIATLILPLTMIIAGFSYFRRMF